tara:strand:+ start:21784 stop:22440 length:657 start_codon:yes stop_codon:yes gene_type:complete
MFTHVEKHEFPNLKREIHEGKRVYTTENGDRYPSVTTVLGYKTKPAIKAWRKKVGEQTANKISRQASVRGTKVHTLCEDYINNEESNTDKITFVEENIFNRMKTYIDRIDNVHCLEQFLFSEHLRLAGQVDCIAEFDGRLSIIDFKTSAKLKRKSYIKNYFAQCSAYAVMFEERTGVPVDQTVIIVGVQDEEPQLFVEKRDNYIDYLLECRDLYEDHH